MSAASEEISGGEEPILRSLETVGSANREDSPPPSTAEVLDRLLLYREIVARSTDAIAIIDPQGRYIEQNEAHAQLTGYGDQELINQTPAIHLGQPVFQMMANALGTQGVFRGEVISHTRHQGDVPVEVSAFAIRDNLGRPVCYVGVQRDIRHRKRAQEEREDLLAAERAARADAERANRVKDEFLATLSHELRTPLNAILGWCQMLRVGGDQRLADLDEALDVIERNTRVQAEIISDLLDMSRIREGKLRLEIRKLDLADVLRAAVNTVKASADAKGVRIETRLELDGCPDGVVVAAHGDFARLQQVVWNLLSNGIKFTPPAGVILVTLRCPDDRAEIRVSDSGPGINPGFQPYLFERFRQADSSATRMHGGLGLGLAIVKSLVEMHGGTVAVQCPGELGGATFLVLLPLSSNGEQQAAGAETTRAANRAPGGAPSLEGVKVLALDDEPDARNLVKRLLELAGAQVIAVGAVGDALEAFDTFVPDVVVSDISLPGIDGYEFIRCIRALQPHKSRVPAVALTAFARPEDRQRALTAGFNEHVPKPVDPAVLVGVLARVVREATSSRQPPRK